MKGQFSREYTIQLLIDKQKLLNENGISRYPKRSDFESDEICAIKAYLGPWPRALETAGIKTATDNNRMQKNIEKHIRAKRLKREALKQNIRAQRGIT